MSDPITSQNRATTATTQDDQTVTTNAQTDSNGFYAGGSAEYQYDKAGMGWIEEGNTSPSSNDHKINGAGVNLVVGYDAAVADKSSLDLSLGVGYNWGHNQIDSFQPLSFDVQPGDEPLMRYMNRTETGANNFELTLSPKYGYQLSDKFQLLFGGFGSVRFRWQNKTGRDERNGCNTLRDTRSPCMEDAPWPF